MFGIFCIPTICTSDEILSWLNEFWMEKQLVCDNNCNIVNL